MLPSRLREWPLALAWLALLVPATLIGGYALRYVNFDPTPLADEIRVNMLQAPVPFVLHTTFGGLALLLGPWQFVARLRRHYPRAHRSIGRCYVLCCLIAGIAAYPVAFGTMAGPVAAWGFSCMATAWLAATLLAFAAIRRGRVAEHRRWMVLSFALTLSAVTLRVSLLVPFFFWLEVMPIYRVTAWTSWIGNLLIALLWLRLSEGRTAARTGLDAKVGAADA
jgi:uncharacterized membrane protein